MVIPNILTTVRLLLIPFFTYYVLVAENFTVAAIIFILSGVTDIVDGIIARKFNMVTNFGKVYDPFVDKLMQITAVVCLALSGIIPFVILAIVIFKEVSMIIIGGILYLKKIVVYSHWYGKAATVIFYAIVFIMIMWRDIPSVFATALLVIMVGSVLCSAGAYLVDIICHYDEKRVS